MHQDPHSLTPTHCHSPTHCQAYIGLGYSLCCLVGGLLSPEFRKSQPGVFNLLFGGWEAGA